MSDVLAFASGKGGTGKTTLALAVGVLAGEQRRAVLVDLDPQASLTEYAGAAPLRPGEADPLTAAPVELHGITLFRGGRTLAAASEVGVAAHLERAVQAAGAESIVVVDLSPSWSDVPHRVVLSRSDARLVLAVRLDAGGLRAARELADLATSRGLPYRIALTFGKRWTVAQTVESSVRAFYGDRVVRAVVPEDVRAAEAAAAQTPLPLLAPRSRSAQAVAALAAELDVDSVPARR